MYIFSNNSFSSFKSSLFIYSIPSFIAGIILLEYVLSISVIFAVGVISVPLEDPALYKYLNLLR